MTGSPCGSNARSAISHAMKYERLNPLRPRRRVLTTRSSFRPGPLFCHYNGAMRGRGKTCRRRPAESRDRRQSSGTVLRSPLRRARGGFARRAPLLGRARGPSRRRAGRSASASKSRRRLTASSRFWAWLRSSEATTRSRPSASRRPPQQLHQADPLTRADRRGPGEVEHGLHPGVAAIDVLPSRAPLPGEPELQLARGDDQDLRDPDSVHIPTYARPPRQPVTACALPSS